MQKFHYDMGMKANYSKYWKLKPHITSWWHNHKIHPPSEIHSIHNELIVKNFRIVYVGNLQFAMKKI